MKKIYLLLLCLVPFLTIAGIQERGLANKMVTDYLERNGGLEVILKNPPFDIKDKTRVCVLCHGPEGNSTKKNVPSLAGQNPRYMVEQLLVFKKGERYPEMMHEIVKDLDEEEMITIALYYSTLQRSLLAKVDGELDDQGKRLYTDLCSHCHGEQATGANESYANIRAQRPDYLITTIKRFRDGDRRRSSHVMGSAVKGISDIEISALANYIAGL